MGHSNDIEVIGRFSIISTGIFLLTHVFSIGNDQSILSTKSIKKPEDMVFLDNRIFIPIFSFIATFSVACLTFNIEIFQDYLDVYLKDIKLFKIEYCLFIALTVFLANMSKTIASFFIISNFINTANTLYLFKSIGLLVGVLQFIIYRNFHELSIVFFMELICFLLLFILLLIKILYRKIIWTDQSYKKDFFIAGLNIFGFDSMLKQDLIILSFFQGPEQVAKYAVLSSVFEGIAQTITTLQQNYSKILRNKIFDSNFEVKGKLNDLLSIGRKLSYLFIFASSIFYFIVFSSLSIEIFIISIFLQIALLAGSPAIITFYTQSIEGNPLRLFSQSICIILINTFVSIMLYNVFGTLGVSIGTMLSFIAMRLIIYNYTKNIFIR